MQILPIAEQKQFDLPPLLNSVERKRYSYLSPDIQKIVQSMDMPHNQLGFLLQYYYFRITGRFYAVEEFHPRDCKFFASTQNIAVPSLEEYSKSSSLRHRNSICNFLNFRRIDRIVKEEVRVYIESLCEQMFSPKEIFTALVTWLYQSKIEGFTYFMIEECITDAYAQFEHRKSVQLHGLLSDEIIESLHALCVCSESETEAPLVTLSSFNHAPEIPAIRENCTVFRKLKALWEPLEPIAREIALSPEVIDYYAKLVLVFQPLQLSRRGEDRFLYLFCFIVHQYRIYQDYLVDRLLHAHKNAENRIETKHKERTSQYAAKRKKLIEELLQRDAAKGELIDHIEESIHIESAQYESTVYEVRRMVDEFRNSPEALPINTEDESEFQKEERAAKESAGNSLNTQAAEIVRLLSLDYENSSDTLREAVAYFRKHERIAPSSAPLDFLSDKEEESLIDETGKFSTMLYRGYLISAVAKAVKSGSANVDESYRYRAFEQYLINAVQWSESRDAIIKSAEMESIQDIDNILNQLEIRLNAQREKTISTIESGKNRDATVEKNGRVKLKRIKAEDETESTPVIKFLPSPGSISLFEILHSIDDLCDFRGNLEHQQHKFRKKTNICQSSFLASIMGHGCNLGENQMGRMIRNVGREEVDYVSRWHLSQENLTAANSSILNLTEKLRLSSVYGTGKYGRHTSSDGQKFTVGINSMDSSFSHKYFGSQKGVSVYSFIDDRHMLYHSTVITPSEREAAYVIDGLMANEVVQSDIHSTDTHGYTEIVFALTHLLGITFAPRIAKMHKQRVYSFELPSAQSKRSNILPSSKRINTQSIKEQWDAILRMVATIKQKEQTASQLLKRLSEYSSQHPLYKALKQFGRIIKSIYIHQYIDEKPLRQAVQKQLNKVESYHKFAKAIFFGRNQEFNHATRDEQNRAESCKRLIANAIICWNYLYLSKKVWMAKSDDQRTEILNAVKSGSMVTWQHVNFHGEYDFSDKALENAEIFNLEELLAMEW